MVCIIYSKVAFPGMPSWVLNTMPIHKNLGLFGLKMVLFTSVMSTLVNMVISLACDPTFLLYMCTADIIQLQEITAILLQLFLKTFLRLNYLIFAK